MAALSQATVCNLSSQTESAYNLAVQYLGANADPTGNVLLNLVNAMAQEYGNKDNVKPATATHFPQHFRGQ